MIERFPVIWGRCRTAAVGAGGAAQRRWGQGREDGKSRRSSFYMGDIRSYLWRGGQLTAKSFFLKALPGPVTDCYQSQQFCDQIATRKEEVSRAELVTF